MRNAKYNYLYISPEAKREMENWSLEMQPKITLYQFADYVNGFSGVRPTEQRLGQWAFNLLCDSYPEIANKIRGSIVDPFHNDKRIITFLCCLLNEFVQPEKENESN